LVLFSSGLDVTRARNAVEITDRGVDINFPENITFKAQISNQAEVKQVVLEYGVEKRSCGTVLAKAFPTPTASTGDVQWTWNMRQSGSEPPGASLWYRWQATDKAGQIVFSDKKRITWLDNEHQWLDIAGGPLVFHWYDQPESYAQELYSAALAAFN